MGANHATTIYATWGDRLNGNAFRLLIHMALTSLDSDNPPHYWGGREGLAAALGRPNDPAGWQAVKRATQVLVAAGAITNVRQARKNSGTNKWRINLFPGQEGGKRTPESEAALNLRGTETASVRGTESDPSGVRKRPHRGTESDPHMSTRNTRSELEEEHSPTKVSADRACEPDDLTHFRAKEILDAAALDGVNIVALMDQAPADCTTKGQRRIWAARQIIAEEAS